MDNTDTNADMLVCIGLDEREHPCRLGRFMMTIWESKHSVDTGIIDLPPRAGRRAREPEETLSTTVILNTLTTLVHNTKKKF